MMNNVAGATLFADSEALVAIMKDLSEEELNTVRGAKYGYSSFSKKSVSKSSSFKNKYPYYY
jgi:hypothetical protein